VRNSHAVKLLPTFRFIAATAYDQKEVTMKAEEAIQAIEEQNLNRAAANVPSIIGIENGRSSRQKSSQADRWKLVATLCVMAMSLSLPARAGEICNYFTAAPSPDGYSYTLIIKGDVTNYISASSTAGDALVDPFTYVNDYYFGGSGTSSVQVNRVGGNTQVVFTGSNPILPSYTFPKTGNKGPHFGLEPMNGGPPKLDVLSQQWNSLTPFSTISVEPPKPGSKYELIYAVSTDTSTGAITGAWFAVPFQPSGHLFTFQNNGSADTVRLSDVGYLITSSDIPLDQLNSLYFPPPGQTGSPFTSLPQYDGQSVGPGGSLDVVTPEPGMLVLFGSGLVGLGAFLRKRRTQAD
jgi:PEP-CTERM motif